MGRLSMIPSEQLMPELIDIFWLTAAFGLTLFAFWLNGEW